jgi:hypothetical protein
MLHKSESVLAASPIIPIAATPLAPRAYRTDAHRSTYSSICGSSLSVEGNNCRFVLAEIKARKKVHPPGRGLREARGGNRMSRPAAAVTIGRQTAMSWSVVHLRSGTSEGGTCICIMSREEV